MFICICQGVCFCFSSQVSLSVSLRFSVFLCHHPSFLSVSICRLSPSGCLSVLLCPLMSLLLSLCLLCPWGCVPLCLRLLADVSLWDVSSACVFALCCIISDLSPYLTTHFPVLSLMCCIVSSCCCLCLFSFLPGILVISLCIESLGVS